MKVFVVICLFGVLFNGLNAQEDRENDQGQVMLRQRLMENATLRRILEMIPPIQAQIIPFEAQNPIQVQFVRRPEQESQAGLQQGRQLQEGEKGQEVQQGQQEQERLPAGVIAPPSPVLPVFPARPIQPAVPSLLV